jgi:hypothetical protein
MSLSPVHATQVAVLRPEHSHVVETRVVDLDRCEFVSSQFPRDHEHELEEPVLSLLVRLVQPVQVVVDHDSNPVLRRLLRGHLFAGDFLVSTWFQSDAGCCGDVELICVLKCPLSIVIGS